jgi:hypothetical protein
MRELNSTENALILVVLGIAVAGMIYAVLQRVCGESNALRD